MRSCKFFRCFLLFSCLLSIPFYKKMLSRCSYSSVITAAARNRCALCSELQKEDELCRYMYFFYVTNIRDKESLFARLHGQWLSDLRETSHGISHPCWPIWGNQKAAVASLCGFPVTGWFPWFVYRVLRLVHGYLEVTRCKVPTGGHVAKSHQLQLSSIEFPKFCSKCSKFVPRWQTCQSWLKHGKHTQCWVVL